MSPSCEKESSETATIETPADTISLPIEQNIDSLRYEFDEDYGDLWKEVDSLQNIGLYASALTVVDSIFNLATEGDVAPQVVKSVIHKMKYNSYLEEDELKLIAKTSTFPLKQIIHSITAETYWGYYQNNRWKFMNRTETVDFDNADIRTWDLSKLSDAVNEQYMLSITSSDSLKHTDIRDFSVILHDYKGNYAERPTLYDFLAHRALDFFQNTETELTRPEYKYAIQGPSYFDDDSVFLTTSTDLMHYMPHLSSKN